MITLPRTTGDVAKMLSSTLAAEKRDNQCYLLKVAESIKFLARQSIPLLGDGDEEDSNYMQLLHLHVADDLQLLSCMQQKKGKYTSPQVQNELLKIMDVHVLKERLH